jgi:hypothetical protein
VFFYFDGAAAEISSGPDAGYYMCPFDFSFLFITLEPRSE